MTRNKISYFLFVFVSSFLLLSAKCKKTEEKKPVIGEIYKGGKVFFIDNTGLHGLVAATTDLGTGSAWGCMGTIISGADGTAVGTGNQNTKDIATGCNEAGNAAQICNDLVLEGFSDWYLPSKDELDLMFKQKDAIGGLRLESYWSSSEVNADRAWLQSMNTGAQYATTNKDYGTNIRPIRAF